MLAGMYHGPGRERILWNQTQIVNMAATEPVVHEFEHIRVPTLLMIGQLDRTAIGADRAPPEIAKKLGNYPILGRAAAKRIPNAKLIEFSDLVTPRSYRRLTASTKRCSRGSMKNDAVLRTQSGTKLEMRSLCLCLQRGKL